MAKQVGWMREVGVRVGVGVGVVMLLGAACGDDAVGVSETASTTGDSEGSTAATTTGTSTDGSTTEGMTGGMTEGMTTGTSTTSTTTTTGETTESTGPICEPGEAGCVCGPEDSCAEPSLCEEGVCVLPVPSVCGDGVVEGDEECDDGNDDNGDACLDTCLAASCGDGFVQAGVEECDDGNDDDSDACPASCLPATCGDGFVQAGVEECDDGNDDETDACLNACLNATCGDGLVQADVEECDDGNDDDSDACVEGCLAATCGDGFVQADVEACDDGDDVDDNECSNSCELNSQCFEGKGYLVVASTSLGQVRVYEPMNLTLSETYTGLQSPQSVAPGPNGKLYVGQSSVIRTVDLVSKQTADIGGGLVSGSLYGMTVYEDRVYASGSGMPSVRMLNLDGSDAGTVASPGGSNLRSTAFGPDGDFYLSSFGSGPMQRWDPGLVYDKSFGGGGLSTAFGVTTRSDGDVIVASQNNARYYIFAKDGTYKDSVAVPCNGQIRNIAADCEDTLYVGCYNSNKVVVYDADNAILGEVAVSTPAGVAVLPALP